MKKILITGANSYIGTAFQNYLAEEFPGKYQVDVLDLRQKGWQSHSFSGYDTVFHVAGIAHSDTRVMARPRRELYYAVNTDLAIQTAQKARADGAGQFLFMSSASVYGDSTPIGEVCPITPQTPLRPANVYGDSKAKAERGIQALEDDSFRVVILRPPMIYGPGSKGNYPALSRLIRYVPLFPQVDNQRSMLYIGNLVEFLRLMVENRERGIFWPQNREYTNTTDMARMIARAQGRRLLVVPGLTWALKGLAHVTDLVNKAFGSLCYAQAMSEYPQEYRRVTLEESIVQTEEYA